MSGAKSKGQDAPVTAPDSLQSVSSIEFIDAISEGELEGFATVDPLESVYLDNTPIKTDGELNFEGVSFEYRLGTQDQTYIAAGEMTTDENPSAAIEFLVNAKIENSLPVVRTINSLLADRVRIRLRVDALWKRDIDTGDVNGTEIEVQIAIKANGASYVDALAVVDEYYDGTVGTGFTKHLREGPGIIRGKASSAYERSYNINLRDYGSPPYDIKVTRVTADSPEDGLIADIVNFEAYTELITAKLRYPNTAHARLSFDSRHFSQVPARGYLLKGIKVRVPGPDFYDPVARTYTGVDWDGTFITAWTRCPAWIFYDIATDPRYGLGKEVSDEYIDKWNLWAIAKRCDAEVSDGFGGVEPRYSMDLYLQSDNSAKTVLQDMASNFDAMGFWHSGGVHLTQDSPKTVTALYTPANVVGGRFNYAGSSRQTRNTVVLVEWNDPDDFYKTAVEYIEDSSGIERYGYRETKIAAIGCTSRGQAHRRGKHALLTARLETDVVSFSVGLSGLVNTPGDIIRIADPLKSEQDRLGGRISTGATTTSIPLDAEVTLEAGESYTLCVILPDGSVVTAPVTNSAGATQLLTVLPALDDVPDQNAIWSLYSGAIPSREYRVLWTTENDEEDGGFYDISAVSYDSDKYAQIEDGLQLQPIYKDPYKVDTIEPPTNITVVVVRESDEFAVKTHLDISWTPSTNKFVNEHELSWVLADGEIHYVTNIVGSSYRIENALPGEYSFQIRAKTIAGDVSAIINNYYILLPLSIISDISIINIGVRGVAAEFFGRDAEFSWESDADTVIALLQSYSSGSGGSSKWFRDFEVNIYESDGTTLRRTEYVTEFYYIYTYEKNVEDGDGTPVRSVTIKVSARNQSGALSQSASLLVANNPPDLFPSISFLPSEGGLAISFTDPVDYDYSYVRFFASQTSGFTPGPTNLIWEGSDNYVNIPIKSEFAGLWYLRAQIVDDFGVSGTSYTPEVSQEVFAPPGAIDPGTADELEAMLIDFNASNNRNSDAITAPVIVTDNTAIDHTINADGSIDVSFEWAWSGDESVIDGFAIYVYGSTNSNPYVFIGNDPSEIVWQVPAYSRTFIWRGVPANLYYTVGVLAFRKVDPDIATDSLISSSLITANGSNENPYYPPTVDPASGDITTTINGILAAHVNIWEHLTGDEKPADYADVTLDQIAGSGANVLNGEYAIISADADYPPHIVVNGSVTLDQSVVEFGYPMARLDASALNTQLTLAPVTNDYNIILTPNINWIVSLYVIGSITNQSGQAHIRTDNAGAFYTLDFVTSPTPGVMTRVYGEIDLSADSSNAALLRIDNDGGSGTSLWFTALMLEQKVGNNVEPSAFVLPTFNYTAPDMPGNPAIQQETIVNDSGEVIVRATCSWAEPAIGSVTDYIVAWKDNTTGSNYSNEVTTETEVIIPPWMVGHSISVKVKARYVTAESDFSAVTTFTLSASDKIGPGIPTNISITQDKPVIDCTWTPPTQADYARTEILGSLTNDRSTAVFLASGYNSASIGGLEPNTVGYLWLKSYDTTGNAGDWEPLLSTNGLPASTVLSDPSAVPDKPTWPTTWVSQESVIDADGRAAILTSLFWNAPATDVTSYIVSYRDTTGNGVWTEYHSTETGLLINMGLLDKTYYIRVKSVNKEEESGWSVVKTLDTTADTTGPNTPTSLNVTNGLDLVVATWSHCAALDYKHTELWFSYANLSDVETNMDLTGANPNTKAILADSRKADSKSFPDLTAGLTGYFWVRHVDTVGNESLFFPTNTNGSQGSTGLLKSRDDTTLINVTASSVVISHTANTDSTMEANVVWAWAGANADITGFEVMTYSSASNAAYTFGTDAENEHIFQVAPDRRGTTFSGVPIDLYHTIAIRAYRSTDADVGSGHITSTQVYATVSPYQGAAAPVFSGEVPWSGITGVPTLGNSNLLPIDDWVNGASGSQGDFSEVGVNNRNSILLGDGPNVEYQLLWRVWGDSIPAYTGGWSIAENVNSSKSHRISVWLRQSSTTGIVQLQSKDLESLIGVYTAYPLFVSGDLPTLNKWYLVVGVIHAYNHGTTDTNTSGIYDPDTGYRITAGPEFKFSSNNSSYPIHHRVLAYDIASGQTVDATRPRLEAIDGNEPTIASMLAYSRGNVEAGDYSANIDRPQGGTYSSHVTQTGAIKIALPQYYTQTMIQMTIDVFLYAGASFSLRVTGYMNSTGSAWDSTTAAISGNANSNNPVRFGNEGGVCCVWIGDTTDNWTHVSVGIRDVITSYNNWEAKNWQAGWDVSIVNSLGTVDGHLSDTLVDANTIKNQGNLALFDQVTATEINVANLAAIEANLGTVTAGSITGTAGIDIVGKVVFKGSYNDGSGSACVIANPINNGTSDGVQGFSGASLGYGVWGDGVTAGVKGTNYGVGDAGIFYSYGTGNGLEATAASSSGMGIRAENTSTSGGGAIKAYSDNSDNTAVFKNSGSGRGLYAWAVGGGDAIYSNGDLYVQGDINYTGVATDVSDIRLKHNVQTIESASEKLRHIRGVSYLKDGIAQLGAIAQEVQSVFPQIVSIGKDGFLRMRLVELIGPLVQAQNETSEKLDSIEKRLVELESKIT